MITKLLIFLNTILMLVAVQVIHPEGIKGAIIEILDWLLELAMGY